jgi:hypothetical protein
MTNMEIVIIIHIKQTTKKYECRTGPFEGFFVSSVEICKHVKFDDRKDDRKDNNRTETQDGDGNGVGTDLCGQAVEACFQQFLSQTQFEQLSEALDSPTGVNVEILGSEVTLKSFEDICSALEPFTQSTELFFDGLVQI